MANMISDAILIILTNIRFESQMRLHANFQIATYLYSGSEAEELTEVEGQITKQL